jgi:hypothetical protein
MCFTPLKIMIMLRNVRKRLMFISNFLLNNWGIISEKWNIHWQNQEISKNSQMILTNIILFPFSSSSSLIPFPLVFSSFISEFLESWWKKLENKLLQIQMSVPRLSSNFSEEFVKALGTRICIFLLTLLCIPNSFPNLFQIVPYDSISFPKYKSILL